MSNQKKTDKKPLPKAPIMEKVPTDPVGEIQKKETPPAIEPKVEKPVKQEDPNNPLVLVMSDGTILKISPKDTEKLGKSMDRTTFLHISEDEKIRTDRISAKIRLNRILR